MDGILKMKEGEIDKKNGFDNCYELPKCRSSGPNFGICDQGGVFFI